ncbi:MAG: energy-coupling factor transporter transmembrane protein EcfT [Clostridium sp.]|jgi:energy-coupling factor transport system permease protein|nr:energy-coupling factor transporter transmembrane protein EcfT [Clostridium sp.]
MASSSSAFGYLPRTSPVHDLTGAAKLLMTIFASAAVMITYDTRFLVFLILASSAIFRLSKVKFAEIRAVFLFIVTLMAVNTVILYLFSPEEGVRIYGSRHEMFRFTVRYTVTQEQLFYLLNVVLKYGATLPIALVFLLTTEPSEFASSLNQIGVDCRIAYAVALALRYIPDIQRDFNEISQAQQARGCDLSRRTGLRRRIRNVSAILFPLIFSSLERIETISSAMELRGFGKHRKRTWYRSRSFRAADFAAVAACAGLVGVSICLTIVNGGRFYNPFR